MTKQQLLSLAKGELFNTEMVRAIMDGRKSRTSRPVKGVNGEYEATADRDSELPGYYCFTKRVNYHGSSSIYVKPKYQVGDYFYVRETWGIGTRPCPHEGWVDGIEYRADVKYLEENDDLILHKPIEEFMPKDSCLMDYASNGWHPNIHMPKWAARTFCRVTGVKVQRVRHLNAFDILKEGWPKDDAMHPFSWWENTWTSIYGQESWDRNDWIFVYEFELVEV